MARKLEQLGAFTIDADVLARDVVALGTEGLKAVVARSGTRCSLPTEAWIAACWPA